MAEEIEPSWKHPGLRADVEFVVSLVSPERAKAAMKWADSWHHTAEDRARTAFEEATEAASVSADELLEAIMADEALTDLFRMAMEQAARTGSQQKLEALGKALAHGALLKDDAHFDQAQLRLRTIGEMEAADIRVLVRLDKGYVRCKDAYSKKRVLDDGSESRTEHDVFPPDPPYAIRAHLERLGLVRQDIKQESKLRRTVTLVLTDYGKEVLRLVTDS